MKKEQSLTFNSQSPNMIHVGRAQLDYGFMSNRKDSFWETGLKIIFESSQSATLNISQTGIQPTTLTNNFNVNAVSLSRKMVKR